LAPELVKALHHESQGLPGSLIPILEHYVEARVLTIVDGQLVVDEARRRKLTDPGAASELLETRLSALSPRRRALLKALSIAPIDLSFDLATRLAAVATPAGGGAEVAAETVADDLDALAAAGVVVA